MGGKGEGLDPHNAMVPVPVFDAHGLKRFNAPSELGEVERVTRDPLPFNIVSSACSCRCGVYVHGVCVVYSALALLFSAKYSPIAEYGMNSLSSSEGVEVLPGENMEPIAQSAAYSAEFWPACHSVRLQ